MSRIEIDNKEHLYIIARWAYSIAKDIMNDEKYAELERYIKSQGLLPEYTNRTWSEDPCPVELLKQYGMEDMIEHVVVFKDTCSIPSITSWEDLRQKFEHAKYPLRLSFKRDGFNFHLCYVDTVLYKGNTRARKGNGLEFKDLSNMNIPKHIPMKGVINPIGEMTLSKTNFRKLRSMYPKLQLVSQRAAVRTALANPEAHHLLKFNAFRIQEIDDIKEEERLLNEWGFETPSYRLVNSYNELLAEINKMGEEAKTDEDPSDGIVVEDMDRTYQWAIRLGYWQTSILKSYIIDIVEESGLFNDVPKLLIRNVLSDENSTHTLVPITNWARIIKYGLEKGSPVAFTLTSKAAPVIDLETTRLLQKQYFGNYGEFRNMIDTEQEALKLSRNFL